jgi:hypothetical protein
MPSIKNKLINELRAKHGVTRQGAVRMLRDRGARRSAPGRSRKYDGHYCWHCPAYLDRWEREPGAYEAWTIDGGKGRIVRVDAGDRIIWFAQLMIPGMLPSWSDEFATLEEAKLAATDERRRLGGCLMIDEHRAGTGFSGVEEHYRRRALGEHAEVHTG